MYMLQFIFCIFKLIWKQSAKLIFVTTFDEGQDD